jgi:hypothetical protein
MIQDGVVVGFPLVNYSGTTAAIEALTGVSAGATAYSTDDLVYGFYNGTSWIWGLRLIGSGWALDGGGNARGLNAVDLQTKRASDDQVASGDYSFIGGGIGNKATANRSMVVGGAYNTSSEINAICVGGNTNTAAGSYSAVIGGTQNQATESQSFICGGGYGIASGNASAIVGGTSNKAYGNFSAVIGGYGNKADGVFSTARGCTAIADKRGQSTTASGYFVAGGGDAQSSALTAFISTSDDTPSELYLDGGLDGGIPCTIASDTTWMFEIHVVARRTDADNESAAYQFIGCIDNNAGTTALVGSITKTVVAEDTAGWDCNVTADNTNDALIITATGENAKTIQWVAYIQLVETTG